MARVINPLLSLSASGSISATITFRQYTTGSRVNRKITPYVQQSQNELINQQRMIDARTAFVALSPGDHTLWNASAAFASLPTWQYFFRQYQFQVIDAPATPQIPEITLR